MLITIAISGYRSIRQLVLPLSRLNVITGPNGAGKSNVYRAIRLISDVAEGNVIASLAHEGGLNSTLWAGPETLSRAVKAGEHPVQGTVRRDRVALKLGFADEDYGYAIDLGLPPPSGQSLFSHDPEIKCEAVWYGEKLKTSNVMADRRGPAVTVLNEAGERRTVLTALPAFDSMITHAADPRNTPELLALRERMRSWRFYDHVRVDRDAPARQSSIGTRTPVLANDGHDLAAACQTIREIGDQDLFDTMIDDAFPGSIVDVSANDGRFELTMRQPGLLRPLRTAEMSDGTLRYLMLVTALLSPRPPALLVLNEPETSLHTDLLEPLARLISEAARSTQIIVVSHARPLVDELSESADSIVHELSKQLGETVVTGARTPGWRWPKR